jgi:serine/threonine protein phosphatase PrpC
VRELLRSDYSLTVISSEDVALREFLSVPQGITIEDRRLPSSWFAFSRFDGVVSAGIFEGRTAALPSQIAVRMAVDTYRASSLDFTADNADAVSGDKPMVSSMLEYALKHANREVYQYSHRMSSGGAIGACGVVVALGDGKFTIGKIGDYEAFLWRGGRPVSIYPKETPQERSLAIDRYVGANAQLLVDRASFHVQDGDIIAVVSGVGEGDPAQRFQYVLQNSSTLHESAEELFRKSAEKNIVSASGRLQIIRNTAVMLFEIGRPTIKLRERVTDQNDAE